MSAQPGSAIQPSSEAVSARMSRQAVRDTMPELALRRELHRRGLRYRVDAAVPGLIRRKVDIVFSRIRVAVFVDGCFWHGCPEHRTMPKANEAWWRSKLERNILRDRETDQALLELGWTVVRVWEHEPPEGAAKRVADVVAHRRSSPTSGG